MKTIKNIILYGMLFFSLGLFWHTVLANPCRQVIEYSIGEFDDRFGISRDEFIDALTRGEEVWEDVSSSELFTYVPDAEFKVNLIYSEEQARIDAGEVLTEKIDTQNASLDTLRSQYDATKSRYDTAIRSYESRVVSYEKQVDYWNAQGGAPEAEFNSLQAQKKSLDSKAREIQLLQNQVNDLAAQINTKVNNYNNNVNEYNTLFGEAREFDAGNTNGAEINIYTYKSLGELHSLIIHEFGHVLGIDHLENPASVMFYLLNDENNLGVLSEEDKQALKGICRVK